MIKKFNDIQLVNPELLESSKNVYSILVGKNGTGKSSFLGMLIEYLIKKSSNSTLFSKPTIDKPNEYPENVIAVSTSPFDKFPVDRNEEIIGYKYLGLRDLNSFNFGLTYLSKIITSLIKSVLCNKHQFMEIIRVLQYLGYNEYIRIDVSYEMSRKLLNILSENPRAIIEQRTWENHMEMRRFNHSFFLKEENVVNQERIERLLHILDNYSKVRYTKTFFIDSSGFNIGDQEADDILFLLEANVARLKDVQLQPVSSENVFSIKNASSGEQSIILSILGIASQIKNNSLICIDEPEICLHPQWQEAYIDILTKTFDNFQNCHFIIATHSPLIISRLPSINSFIIDMESKLITSASQVINNSSDYQLATVLGYPGFKNEYLARIALNIFSKVSNKKKFDEDDISKLNIIGKYSSSFRQDDPVYDLYKTLNELLEIYGRH